MKKLGKKRASQSETVQAYACNCTFCACPSCANDSVKSALDSGEMSRTSGTLMLLG